MQANQIANVLSFQSHLGRYVGPLSKPEKLLTLRAYYEAHVRPEIEHQSRRSLTEDRTAIRNWELHTGDPDLRAIGKTHLVDLRDGMKAAGRSPATINKTWREIKAILEVAKDEGAIAKVPQIGIGMKTKLLAEPPKMQREVVTPDEVTRLWHACRYATYPDPAKYPTVQAWRTILLLFWVYGPRTLDLFRLRWDSMYAVSKMLRFEAMKTRKVQGLPLVEEAIRQIENLRGADADFIIPGFRTPGAFLRGPGKWQRGYYTTWRTEITPNASLDAPILFKHFRESMVTNLNGVESNLGNWIAGHYVPGVSAQNYDLPTERIRRAIDSVVVPQCFRWPPAGASAG